jgi:hypothetical protein
MSKAEKKLNRWLTNPPIDEPVKSVRAFIQRYFAEQWRWEGGSHIVIEDERLKGHEFVGPACDFTVPVKGGQKVKGRYLRRLAILVKYLDELGKGG